MSEAVVSSPELDYSSLVSSHGSYKISRVRPLDSDTQTLLANATIETLIELPTASKVVNFEKSSLSFTLTKTAESSDAVMHSLGLACIDRVILYDKGGQYLAEINAFDDFHRGVAPYVTKFSEIKSNPSCRGAVGEREKGYNIFCSQSPTLGAVFSAATPGTRNGSRLVHGAGNSTIAGEAADVPSDEPQYLITSASAGAITLQYNIPFKQFFHTILSTNRDMFFGTNLMMSIHWAPYTRQGYKVTASETSLATGAAALATGITVSNIQLKLAVETNPEVVNFLVNSVRSSGITTKIPFVKRYQFVNNAGTLVNNQLRLNRRDGMRLLNIYSMLFHQDTTGGLAHNLANFSGTTNIKEANFQSTMNTNQLQEYRVDANGDDYEILKNKNLLDDCVISTNNVYQYNRVWIESWRSGPCSSWLQNDTAIDGYDLSEEAIYVMDKTVVSGTYRHVLYTVCLRELNISSNGSITIA